MDDILTLKHYKEPLLAVEKENGFGYYGALSVSLKDEKLQCHVCGELFDRVGTHAGKSHQMSVKEYKEKYRLSPTSALVSEPERQRMKEAYMRLLLTRTPEVRALMMQKAREGRDRRKREQPKEALEAKNKKGTYPDQLIDKIKKCAEVIGHTPSKREFIDYCESQRFVHLIYKTFGSWKEALKMAKLVPEQQRPGGRRNYSNEELLEYLNIFWQENQKIPTETDCRRGLVPDSQVYKRHFGSLPKARELAGITDVPTRWTTLPRKFKEPVI